MLLKIFFLLLSLFGSATSNAVDNTPQHSAVASVRCEKQLRPILERLQELPEADQVIQQILEKGPLSIRTNRHLSSQFEGYWSASNRTIYLTKSSSDSALLTTLLFEMHNAIYDEELGRLDHLATQHQISRDKYIRSVELWEYQNAKATATILEKGIEEGIYPEGCHWPLHDQFEDHFAYQKHAGHSSHIGRMYDKLF